MATIFLSKLFGIFFSVMGLGALFHRKHMTEVLKNILAHPALQMISGLFPLFLGAWVVLVHNVWAWDWSLVLTLAGWLMLLIGVFRLWCVELWVKKINEYKDVAPVWGGFIVLVFGVLLLYVGFFH